MFNFLRIEFEIVVRTMTRFSENAVLFSLKIKGMLMLSSHFFWKQIIQSALALFLGDLLRPLAVFSCFSIDFDNFQDKMAEIKKSGASTAPT